MAQRGKKVLLKVIVLGDSGVGKTCLMHQFVKNKFSEKYKATIGADFLPKDITIDDKLVTLQIWDTAGQERFMSLGLAFYRGADVCVLCYDITNPKSFEHVQNWKEDFLTQAEPPDPENFPFILIGNKVDLEMDRKVAKADALKWCKSRTRPIPHFETSAKDATRVEAAFAEAAMLALEQENTTNTFVPEALSIKLNQNKPAVARNDCC